MSETGQFDPRRARAKRPFPLWVDALVRDTYLLETDEFGAYIKIMMAMWGSLDVAIPNDPRKLARIAGVSLRLWNSRIGPALSGFWTECENGITQNKLRKEAVYTERQVKSQSDRKLGDKLGEKNDKLLKNNDMDATADTSTDTSTDATTDTSTDTSTDDPTQLPNIYRGRGSARAREDEIPDPEKREPQTRKHPESAMDREQILEAIGVDPSGLIGPNGKIIGNISDMQEVRRWKDDLGLTIDEICQIIREIMPQKVEGPPTTFSYFTRPMQRYAAEKSKPKLVPIEGGNDVRNRDGSGRKPHQPNSEAGRAHAGLIAAFQRAVSDE